MERILRDWFYELGDAVDWSMLMSSALVIFWAVLYSVLVGF